MTAPQEPTARGLFPKVGGAIDRVPTKWFATGFLALFLAVSAAFGGLNSAPVKPIPVLAAGEVSHGAQLDLTVDRVTLVDEIPDLFLEPENEGDRLMAVVVTIENRWNRAVTSAPGAGVPDNLRVRGVDGVDPTEPASDVIRLDDATRSPDFQPGVPVQVAMIWEVPAESVAAGDAVTIELYDKTYVAKGFVTTGDRFDTPFLTATVDVEAREGGT